MFFLKHSLKLQIIYDKSFNDFHLDPVSVINQIVIEAKTHFLHPSLGPMKINLEPLLPYVELGPKQIKPLEANGTLMDTSMITADPTGFQKIQKITMNPK